MPKLSKWKLTRIPLDTNNLYDSHKVTRLEEIKEVLIRLDPLISNLDSKAYELLLLDLYQP